MKIILTVPPYASFKELAENPRVEAIRYNTNLTINHPLEDILSELKQQAGKKPFWIDLKCRQLRITNYSVRIHQDKEIHYLQLNHNIEVDTPTDVWIDGGNFIGKITEIKNKNTIVVPSSTEKGHGLYFPAQGEIGIRPGMAINILAPSLKIEGYLTKKCERYIEAGKKLGIHNYMLSFVEQESDIADLLTLDQDAEIIAKIESKKGLDFVKNSYHRYRKKVNLMAARGDGYLEVETPDKIIDFCEEIIKADRNAVFASRMFESAVDGRMLACQDLFDVYCGMQMGYKRFLTGDEVCKK